MMKESATISFEDVELAEEAVAIVRHDADHVALCLSLKSNGDVEVTMKKQDARRLLDALRRALE
jgi:hypothetical protein